MSIINREMLIHDKAKFNELLKSYLNLYAVTDRTWTQKQTLAEQVIEAIEGGATCVQLREKDMHGESLLKEALEIGKICRQYKTLYIINDDVPVAVKCEADGVHIGQGDMNVSDARKIVGEKMIIGVSAQTVEQAKAAESGGADYLGVGAVFSTSTKTDADSVSPETLKDICESVEIPVIAIGGISSENIGKLKGTGIVGVAVVSAIFAADSVKSAAEDLRKKCDFWREDENNIDNSRF